MLYAAIVSFMKWRISYNVTSNFWEIGNNLRYARRTLSLGRDASSCKQRLLASYLPPRAPPRVGFQSLRNFVTSLESSFVIFSNSRFLVA